MTTNKPLAVLRSEIPVGGFGRRITSTEAKAIREAGHSVPRGAIVIRAHGLATRGFMYKPSAGSYSDVGVILTVA